MAKIWSIRGTNGSGKSTLVRAFLPNNQLNSGGPVALAPYDAPTKKEPDRVLIARGYVRLSLAMGPVGIIGPYETACGGLDAMPNFSTQQASILVMLETHGASHVFAEGILASTVAGSWLTFADKMRDWGHTFNFVYLTTPVEVCLERIRQRQEAAGRVREIKEDQVRDKVKAIAATRGRALAAGHPVYDLPHGDRVLLPAIMTDLMMGKGEMYRGQ